MLHKRRTAPPGKESPSRKQTALNAIAIFLCILLIPILIVNCVLLVQSVVREDEIPSIGGHIPLIVLTESMDPEIRSGDMIVCKTVDASEIQVGDVISFFDPEGNGTSVVTHRVLEIEVDENSGALYFRTKGDNNNLEDRLSVPAENLVGVWTGIRIAFIGSLIMFMQSALGLVVCILIPVAVIVAIYLLNRKKQDHEKQSDIDTLRAELEALKAAQQNGNADAESGAEESSREDAPKEE